MKLKYILLLIYLGGEMRDRRGDIFMEFENGKERKPNRLIGEKSPYLLQHAYNPVEWYPWGRESFEKAEREDKPIFLSIGYSTCHWCHVMEEESFENDEIAGILNREFVCVKVDREERPDVDSVYMSVCQAMTGQGGWPLTIIMTPECRPFFAGTYLPPVRRYGRMGLAELLNSVAKQWKENRQQLLGSAEQIQAFLRQQAEMDVEGEVSKALVSQGYQQLERSFDEIHGGFGGAPKFPTPHHLLFLMDYGVRRDVPEAFYMVERTLVQMYRGGIFDHVGGGFSRYSTDERWLVPHFEKMLYDNALLTLAYAKAYGITGKKLYADVAGRILGYVKAELTDEGGGFYCGQDADSDGVEGKYYVFTPEEIRAVLGNADGEHFLARYGMTGSGNFEGKWIPNLLDYQGELEEMQPEKDRRLYEYRLARARLHKDDKILVSWNGWMITACGRAGAVLEEDAYVEMAVRAEAFLREKLVKDGRLMVRYRDGEAAGEGKLDDYACYCQALVELYEVTYETDYLRRARELADVMVEQFFDEERGGFYLYAKDGEALIVRTKETYDGAMPSGNSVAALVLEQLGRITGEMRWAETLDKQLRFLAGAMEGYPAGQSYGLLAMMNVLYPTKELVCVLADEEWERRKREIRRLAATAPGLAVVVKTKGNEKKLGSVAPYTKDYPVPERGGEYYLCSGGQCMRPVRELEMLMRKLEVRL